MFCYLLLGLWNRSELLFMPGSLQPFRALFSFWGSEMMGCCWAEKCTNILLLLLLSLLLSLLVVVVMLSSFCHLRLKGRKQKNQRHARSGAAACAEGHHLLGADHQRCGIYEEQPFGLFFTRWGNHPPKVSSWGKVNGETQPVHASGEAAASTCYWMMLMLKEIIGDKAFETCRKLSGTM